ncbi:toxin glutamine deamidase domain-containing protein [Micromonospora sp. CPCC 205539]|uniref:toxin glutamine deamidase domain-containing protein n=1 Tax=Micromonospora sp. CPCC 205539 TaxID=3122408 RepID=UPI002FF2A1C9
MSVLPSPIPHPLDFAPWDVPGWIYDALDWVVGVQWPEGNERAVWDLADQWYAVASVLAGPQADAAAAAAEVRSGYGGVGAVDAAFEAAWRAVADGDEAPLPVLLAVTADLGRLVEECGCDIEGAKLEVWIELGILVIELLSLAVAALLTAGAATPAAGAAITATRLLIQQIIKRLLGQLASKTLKHGLKEAGERAAKEVTKGGVRGFAKRATREGLEEAGEEAGISLATQAYQNSTGRAHGLDMTDLGASAVGGLAGGAVAPLAGLGRHATGRAAKVGEHLGREMTGEMLAESAAGLATGQGLTPVEDIVRAAASGVTGSATGQADKALHARLDAQANALGGASLAGPWLPPVDSPADAVAGVPSDAVSSATASSLASSSGVEASPAEAASPAASDVGLPREAGLPPSPDGASPPLTAAGPSEVSRSALPPDTATSVDGPVATNPTLSSVVADPTLSTVTTPVAGTPDSTSGPAASAAPANAPPANSPSTATGPVPPIASTAPVPSSTSIAPASPVASSVASSVASPVVAAGSASPVASAGPASPVASAGPESPVLSAGPASPVASARPASPVASSVPAPPIVSSGPVPPATSNGPAPPVASAGPVAGLSPGVVTTPGAAGFGAWGTTVIGSSDGTAVGRSPVPARFRVREALAPVHVPDHPARGRASIPADVAALDDPSLPGWESSDWYAARWAAEADAVERRRYQGYYETQRTRFENNRRQAEAIRLRTQAAEHDRRASEYASYAHNLRETGHPRWADGWQRTANDEVRAYTECLDLADAVLAGTTAPPVVDIGDAYFRQANEDVGALALGAVETADRSGLSGRDVPPPIDDTRPYGRPGGLRPPLALHQVDVERRVPREPDGTVTRTADPRRGGWFRLLNDGGPRADATRGINCLDCTLSLYETWVHGRPRVSAPRTFDGYLDGDTRRPIRGEAGGPGRVEDVTGGRFQRLLAPANGQSPHPAQARQVADRGYANLHDQLLLGGHGSYAFLITEWPNGGSHAWVALNQNGTVLYADPQSGLVRDRPLYPDVVGIDALLLSGDGRPMPLGGLPRGRFSERPDLPDHPPARDDGGHGDPYINRMYLLLDGPGSVDPAALGDDGTAESDQLDQTRSILLRSTEMDQVFAAGVSPAEFASAVDAPTLRRLVPDLDEAAARDVAQLFADARVQAMLDSTGREPPPNEPELAHSLVRQLVQRPDLARMILATPELANSLTARPLTLHHLASHRQAIDVLGEVLDDLAEQEAAGLEAESVQQVPPPQPTPLSDEQRRISASVRSRPGVIAQAGFDESRRADDAYRQRYLDDLYSAAAVAQEELNQLAVALAQVDDHRVGEPGWRPQPKDRRRAEDKVNMQQGDASKLLDLAAAKVEFQRLDDPYAALARVRDHPGVEIVSCEDRFVSPISSGYRDVQLGLRTQNGHVAEFRLHLAALDAVAVWEHVLYEVRRDVEALAQAEGRSLTLRERVITGGIRRREQELFWQALQSTFEGNT